MKTPTISDSGVRNVFNAGHLILTLEVEYIGEAGNVRMDVNQRNKKRGFPAGKDEEAPERSPTMESPFRKEDKKKRHRSQALSRYHIKKTLLNKAGRRCAHCYRKTVPVRLARVHKKNKQPKESDYILLCHDCILKRQEKRKEEKKRLWRRKAARRKITRGGFWNKVRPKVLERDNYTCVWCGAKEKQKLGLGSLIPESRGGKLTFDNFVTTCSHCRPSKGNKLPLEFIFESIDIDEYLKGELDEHLRVGGDPGKYVKIRFFLFSEISEFLHKLTSNKNLPSRIRTRSEQLNIKLLR